MNKCMEYEVAGARPRGRPNMTWREIVEKRLSGRKLKTVDAMDRIISFVDDVMLNLAQ